jgi:hypothetical protein
MYFRSLGLITDGQLILGLGIHHEQPSINANLEASGGLVGVQELKQNPK